MRWKLWGLGFVALAVFDAVLILGVKAYWRYQAAVSIDTPPVPSSVRFVPPAGARPDISHLQTACVAGVQWTYYPGNARWFKSENAITHKPLLCTMRDVRGELRHEGAITVHPKGWQPPAHNFTQ